MGKNYYTLKVFMLLFYPLKTIFLKSSSFSKNIASWAVKITETTNLFPYSVTATRVKIIGSLQKIIQNESSLSRIQNMLDFSSVFSFNYQKRSWPKKNLNFIFFCWPNIKILFVAFYFFIYLFVNYCVE